MMRFCILAGQLSISREAITAPEFQTPILNPTATNSFLQPNLEREPIIGDKKSAIGIAD